MVGLRHLDGGLAHHHCQHYHHEFGVDDFTDEAPLPLKIECIGATLTEKFLSKVHLKTHTKTCISTSGFPGQLPVSPPSAPCELRL